MTNSLNSIKGQTKVVEILNRFVVSGQVPHALLFTGPKNVGQHFAARQFIKELLNNSLSDKKYDSHIDKLEEPFIKYVVALPRGKGELSEDAPLKKISGNELDNIKEEIQKKCKNSFHEVSIENANNIKITSIRDIKRSLSINYDEIPYRLILIEEAHLMGTEAQNALLKSLEEPPPGVIFILISDKPEVLLPTIKSRCWQINFAPLSDDVLNEILLNNFDIKKDLVREVIPFANGSVFNVFRLLDNGFEELLEVSIQILRNSIGHRYNTAIKLFNKLIDKKSKSVVSIMIQLFINWFNDVQKMKVENRDIHFDKYEDTIQKFILGYSFVKLDEVIFALNSLESKIKRNVNLNLLTLNIIFTLASITKR